MTFNGMVCLGSARWPGVRLTEEPARGLGGFSLGALLARVATAQTPREAPERPVSGVCHRSLGDGGL